VQVSMLMLTISEPDCQSVFNTFQRVGLDALHDVITSTKAYTISTSCTNAVSLHAAYGPLPHAPDSLPSMHTACEVTSTVTTLSLVLVADHNFTCWLTHLNPTLDMPLTTHVKRPTRCMVAPPVLVNSTHARSVFNMPNDRGRVCIDLTRCTVAVQATPRRQMYLLFCVCCGAVTVPEKSAGWGTRNQPKVEDSIVKQSMVINTSYSLVILSH